MNAGYQYDSNELSTTGAKQMSGNGTLLKDAGIDDGTVERLMSAAREAAKHAYVPYSGFPVGAAVLTGSGEIVSGVNIENASSGLTVCGERVAIFTAAALGHRTLRAVAVSAPRAAGTTPCGACRQVINEFKPDEGELIVLLDHFDRIVPYAFSGLLPAAFGPRDLERAT
jgi:cytidine deaminase